MAPIRAIEDDFTPGQFPNGDDWPDWAWEDWHMYGLVASTDKNERIDPTTLRHEQEERTTVVRRSA